MTSIRRAVTPGITERPYVPGWAYVGFVVHPLSAGPVTLCIAHREGRNAVLDVAREGMPVAAAADLLNLYRIARVTGAEDTGDGGALAHAAAGAVVLALRGVGNV